MLDWKKFLPVAGLALAITGCDVTTTKTVETVKSDNSQLSAENAALREMEMKHREWRKSLIQFEDRIARLDALLEPLAPLKEKNMELMSTNAREGEEAGGGSLSEIFYLVQTAYSELDLQAANLATDINTAFNRDDFIQVYLYDKLQDKVVACTVEIAELVNRRSSHMATDRRLVTARLKALNECFMALRNLSENKVFDLSFNQRRQLLEKIDVLRVQYAKILKTDFFPAIPHFVPMASGEDYLKGLQLMSEYIAQASIFYANPNSKSSSDLATELGADLKRKMDALKSDTAR